MTDSLAVIVAEMRDTNSSVTIGGRAEYPVALIAEWADRIAALEAGAGGVPLTMSMFASRADFDAALATTPQADPAPPVAGEVATRLERIAGGALEHEADEVLVRLAAYLLRDHARMVAEKDAEIDRLLSDFDFYVKQTRAAEQRAEAMAGLLRHCMRKIDLYREANGGQYLGGVEYTDLRRQIDALLRDGLAGQEGAG